MTRVSSVEGESAASVNVPCLDDAGGVQGELHDHSAGGLYPIGACDVQVIVVGPAEDRAELHALAKFLMII